MHSNPYVKGNCTSVFDVSIVVFRNCPNLAACVIKVVVTGRTLFRTLVNRGVDLYRGAWALEIHVGLICVGTNGN